MISNRFQEDVKFIVKSEKLISRWKTFNKKIPKITCSIPSNKSLRRRGC